MYDIRFLFYSRWFTCLFGQHTPMLVWGSNCAAKAVLEVPEAAEQDESEKWALNAPRESESCLNRILAEVLMLGTLGNVCFSSLKIFVFHLYITWLEKLLATSVCLGVGSAPRTLKGGKIMLQLIWFRDNGAFLKVPPSAAGIKSSKKKSCCFLCVVLPSQVMPKYHDNHMSIQTPAIRKKRATIYSQVLQKQAHSFYML